MNRKQPREEQTLLNDEINFPEVRCMDDSGKQYGIISSNEALKIAEKVA